MWYNAPMTERNLPNINLQDITKIRQKIAKEEFNAFLEKNEMIPVGEDLYEDAGGHVWHESNIEDEIKHQKKGK